MSELGAPTEALEPVFLPWQTASAAAWLGGERARFAHAWLLHGQAGIGKRQFAWAAAASLLCEQPRQGLACGECPACRWLRQGNHPDFRVIRPDAVALAEGAQEAGEPDADGARAKKTPSREIRIEQVRELERWITTATHRGGWRVVLLYPVHSLNPYAANALLKMLEEPPAHTVFLMVTDAPDRVLPTLLSRSRRLPLAAPEPAQAQAWLESMGVAEPQGFLAAAGQAPVAALAMARQNDRAWPEWLPVWLEGLGRGQGRILAARLAGDLEKQPATEWLAVLQRTVCDLQWQQNGLAPRYYPGLAAASGALAARCGKVLLAEFARYLSQQIRVANHPLNARLFAQATLLRMAETAA